MYIADDECPVANFKSSCSERLGLWITVGGIIVLGIASCCYSSLLDLSDISTMQMYFIN